jgi:hypothetical protein
MHCMIAVQSTDLRKHEKNTVNFSECVQCMHAADNAQSRLRFFISSLCKIGLKSNKQLSFRVLILLNLNNMKMSSNL